MTPATMAQVLHLIAQLIALLLPIALTALGTYVARAAVPIIRDRAMQAYIATAVRAAQQSIPDKSKRYDYVAALVSARYPGLSADDVKMLIEAAVATLKMSLGAFAAAVEPTPPPPPAAPPIDKDALVHAAAEAVSAAINQVVPGPTAPAAPAPARAPAPAPL